MEPRGWKKANIMLRLRLFAVAVASRAAAVGAAGAVAGTWRVCVSGGRSRDCARARMACLEGMLVSRGARHHQRRVGCAAGQPYPL